VRSRIAFAFVASSVLLALACGGPSPAGRARVPPIATAATSEIQETVRAPAVTVMGPDADDGRAHEESEQLRLFGAQHHQRAEVLRIAWWHQRDEATAASARAEFDQAIVAYRASLAAEPLGLASYQTTYDLATALYWGGRFTEAADVFLTVRDSALSRTHFVMASALLVEALRHVVAEAERRGDIPAGPRSRARLEDPAAVEAGSTSEAMPPLVQRLFTARDEYLSRVEPADDVESRRDHYALDNADLLDDYGHTEEARTRRLGMYLAHCSGPDGSWVGEIALDALRSVARREHDEAEVQRLDADERERRCTYRRPLQHELYDPSEPEQRTGARRVARLLPGERALSLWAQPIGCSDPTDPEDHEETTMHASAGSRVVRIELRNALANCAWSVLPLLAHLRADGTIAITWGDLRPGQVVATCECRHDLDLSIRGVPAGEHDVVFEEVDTHGEDLLAHVVVLGSERSSPLPSEAP
jgi:hypothetical protein